jgi:hypothetical protein
METLVTVILIGICTAVLIAMHLHLTARPAEPLLRLRWPPARTGQAAGTSHATTVC